MNRYLLTLVFTLWASFSWAFPPGFVEILGSGGVAAVADETFDAADYDLGAAWTETDTADFLNPDSTTQVISGQSLALNRVSGSSTVGKTCYDFGAGANERDITVNIYPASVTLPTLNSVGTFLSVGSSATVPSQANGIIVSYTNASGVLYARGRSSTYGATVALSGMLNKWSEVRVQYVRNGTSTITIDGTGTTITTTDMEARYLCLGAVYAPPSDFATETYFENVDGL